MAIGRPKMPVAERLAALMPRVEALISEVTAGAFPRKTLEKYKIHSADEEFLRENYDAFTSRFARACEAGAGALAERLLEIASEHDNPAMARVVSQNMQWYLERVHRKSYAPSVDINVNQQISISSALSEARARISRPIIDPQDIIDAEIVAESSLPALGAPDYESDAPAIPDRNGLQLSVKAHRPDSLSANQDESKAVKNLPDIFG